MFGIDVSKWQKKVAVGHTPTILASFITLWAIGVILFSWYLVAHESKITSYILAGIILYEVLP